MSVHDLKRAAAQYATALFLLNTQSPDKLGAKVPNDQAEESNHAQSMDAQVLMQSLISKSAFPGLPIFAQVQDIQFKDLSNTVAVTAYSALMRSRCPSLLPTVLCQVSRHLF
ncbi:hypothetical protein BASA81_016748 [Batrachochytrium salamandrivorans]|nr:hypothetical protein BASA81_016748 [Batrachochytrium salamandrivorans]